MSSRLLTRRQVQRGPRPFEADQDRLQADVAVSREFLRVVQFLFTAGQFFAQSVQVGVGHSGIVLNGNSAF